MQLGMVTEDHRIDISISVASVAQRDDILLFYIKKKKKKKK
jgi:hypothetical protein